MSSSPAIVDGHNTLYTHNAEDPDYRPKYWGSGGKHKRLFNWLHDQMVPARGDADTRDGQAVRHLHNFVYERFNNGHCNPTKREREFLRRYEGGRFAVKAGMSDEALDDTIDRFCEHMVDKMTEGDA